VLVLEAAEELDEKERVSLDSLGFAQELLVGLGTQNVRGDLGDGLTPERAEADHLGPRLLQLVLGVLDLGKALVRAERHHPADGQGGEPLWKLPHRHRAVGSAPVQVIEADEQGVPECRLFDQGLDVLEQPEPLLGGRVLVAEGAARDEGVVPGEERVEERVELDHLAMRLGHSTSDPEGALCGHGHTRIQKAGFAEPSPPLDDDDRADPGTDLVEAGADSGELAAAATQRRLPSASYHRVLTPGVYVRPARASRPRARQGRFALDRRPTSIRNGSFERCRGDARCEQSPLRDEA
jgi:hypothetical protein